MVAVIHRWMAFLFSRLFPVLPLPALYILHIPMLTCTCERVRRREGVWWIWDKIYEKGGLKMGSFILIVNSSCKYWFNYFILKRNVIFVIVCVNIRLIIKSIWSYISICCTFEKDLWCHSLRVHWRRVNFTFYSEK